MPDLLSAALAYAELGYAVMPCRPGSKVPLTAHGLLDATTDAEQIAEWWEATPDANVAIVTTGMVVVDVDGAGNPWLSDRPDRAAELLSAPIALTPRGGRHFLFRQPPTGGPWRNTTGKLAPNVDTRADGGYILVSPSVLAGGKAYQWINPLDWPLGELPVLPAWLAAELCPTQRLERSSRSAASPDTSTAPGARAERLAVANTIPEGQRNATLARLAGVMRRAGMGQAEIAAALQVANAQRCSPPIPPAEVDRIAQSVARYEPDQITVAGVENHWGQMLDESTDPRDKAPVDPGPFPERLLTIPGFLSEYLDFAAATAPCPQPILALAGGLALLATITGRKVMDPSGMRTNLYLLGVANTGSGKERAREINKELLYAAGLVKMAGPESLASHSGLLSAVDAQPAILFQLDEMGLLLRVIRDARAAPHLARIPAVLMSLYSGSKSIFACDAFADTKKNKVIDQPHACVYGTTTPKTFYESLTADGLTNGFYSRLLVLETPDEPEIEEIEMSDVPQSLVDGVRYWGEFRPSPGNLAAEHPKPAKIDYAPDAKAMLKSFSKLASAAKKSPGECNAIWSRAVEKARKLAMLYACSAKPGRPIVDLAAVEWGIAMADYLTQRMLAVAHVWVAESPYDAKRLRVLRIIREAGAAGATRSQLCHRLRQLPIREREEALSSLVASGEVREIREDTRGAPLWRYVAI